LEPYKGPTVEAKSPKVAKGTRNFEKTVNRQKFKVTWWDFTIVVERFRREHHQAIIKRSPIRTQKR
jgi:hypothetical protein